MDKRYLVFWVFVVLIWLGWIQYMEWVHPRPQRKAVARKQIKQPNRPKGEKPAIGRPKGEEGTPPVIDAVPPAEAERGPAPEVPPRDDLTLGASVEKPGPDAKFDLFVKLSNRGAMVTDIRLNRYFNEKLDGPLVIVREETHATGSFLLSLEGDIGVGLAYKNWNVVESTPERVVFRTTVLDDRLQVEKRFSLDEESSMIKLDLGFENLTDKPISELNYTLTGGNGLPIEGKWYASYFRAAVAAMTPPKSSAYLVEHQAADIAKAALDEDSVQLLKKMSAETTPLQYGGVVDQYFASLVIQPQNPVDERQIAKVEPFVVGAPNKSNPQFTNIGVKVTGTPISLGPRATSEHQYLLYNGPKEAATLDGYGLHLPLVIHYPNIFFLPIGMIAPFLVSILDFFDSIVHDYGLSIIMLTVMVRCCLLPLTLKSTRSMQKMQEVQPLMEELKQKHANDKQKLNQEVMALYRRHNANPLGGCLPMLLQMPIFISLYQAMRVSFNLRQSEFLWGFTWIKDLAAPDQLFGFGMVVPFLGPYFNLLPILTGGQMLLQMKLTAPKASTPEAEMQRKMMNYMMVFMMFLFYKVPSGLCVYFLTSGAWSMAERKLITKVAPKPKPGAVASVAVKPAIPAPSNGDASWKTTVKTKKKGKAKR